MLSPKPPSRPVRQMDPISFHRAVTSTYKAGWTPPTASPAPAGSRPKRRWIRWVALTGSLAVIAPVIALAVLAFSPATSKLSPARLVASTVRAAIAQPVVLQGQSQDRTNFLVLGMTKDGMRTDSIMLASYYYKDKKLATVNIPRDLYVYDGYEHAKMGEVYAYAKGRQRKAASYPDSFLANLISKEYGIPMQYWVQFNMQGEVQLVDALGGVDVTVPNTFTDNEYPKWDYSGYIRPAPHFDAGLQHMDGTTALIYSRSRHSLDGKEGTDFARSKRQTLVLQSLMTKVKALGIMGNLSDISKYLSILGNNVSTNFNTDEMVALAADLKSLNPQTDYAKGNWSTDASGFLCSSTSSIGAYITLYGVPGQCSAPAGTNSASPYRAQAIAYVQNLLVSASAPVVTPAPALAKISPSNTTSRSIKQ